MVVTIRELELFEQEYLIAYIRDPSLTYGAAFLNHFPELSEELFKGSEFDRLNESLIRSADDVEIVVQTILQYLTVIKE